MSVTQPAGREWTVAHYCSHDGSNIFLQWRYAREAGKWRDEGSSDQVQLVQEADLGQLPVVRSGLPNEKIRLPEKGEFFPHGADLASKEHLKDFIVWSMKTYPSKKFALAVSSHGAGMMGVITDADHPRSCMSIREFRDALLEAKKETGRGVDLLVFNCCLMGQEEVFNALKDTADQVVASSTPILGGLSFKKLLKGLKKHPNLSSEEAARSLVSSQPSGILFGPPTETLLIARGGKNREELQARLDSAASSLLTDLQAGKISASELQEAAKQAPGVKIKGFDPLLKKVATAVGIGIAAGALLGPVAGFFALLYSSMPVIGQGISRLKDEMIMQKLGYRDLDSVLKEFGKLTISEESRKKLQETRAFLSQSFKDSQGKGPHVYLAPQSIGAQWRLDSIFQKLPISQGEWGAMVSMINGHVVAVPVSSPSFVPGFSTV